MLIIAIKLYYNTIFKNQKDQCLKIESIKYYSLDYISLYRILNVFNNLIFNKFKININKYLILSSLNFAIFLIHYLAVSIPMLSKQIGSKIRKFYTSRATNMFILCNSDNELVYTYNINLLYPLIMKDKQVYQIYNSSDNML